MARPTIVAATLAALAGLAGLALRDPGGLEVVEAVAAAQIADAVDLAVDGAGIIFVASAAPCRVVRLGGGARAEVAATCATDLAIGGPRGELFVLTSTGAVLALGREGGEPRVVSLPRDVRPVAIAVSPDGDLDVADAASGRVLTFTDGGVVSAGSFETLVDVAAGARCTATLDRSGRRVTIVAGGVRATLARDPPALRVAVAGDDRVALLGGETLELVDARGRARAAAPTAALGVERPAAVVAAGGRLYLLDGAGGRVVIVREGRSLARRAWDAIMRVRRGT